MNRTAATLSALLLGVVASGCAGLTDGSCKFGIDYYKFGDSDLTAPGSLKSYGNAFVKVQNKKGGAGAYGFMSSPFDLWAPFHWETTFGKLDQDSPGSGTGFACTELDVRGSNPLEFYALCVRADAGGYTCWVAKKGTSVVAQVFLAATGIVQGSVEHDGANLVFKVKKPSDIAWTTITTIAQTQTEALVPSIGFAQAPAGAQTDFDDMRIVANGPLPEDASPERILARVVMDAGMPLGSAAREIDGSGIDLQAAADHLAEAIDLLTTAETTVADGAPDMADPKAGAKAVKWIRSARKSAEKAGKVFEKGKPFKTISVAIQKALAEVYAATQTLDPHTLPGQ